MNKLVVLCALYVTHKAVRLPINLFFLFHSCYQVKLRSTNRTSKVSWKKLHTSQEQIVSHVYKEPFIKLKELWSKLLACLEERLSGMKGLYSSYLALAFICLGCLLTSLDWGYVIWTSESESLMSNKVYVDILSARFRISIPWVIPYFSLTWWSTSIWLLKPNMEMILLFIESTNNVSISFSRLQRTVAVFFIQIGTDHERLSWRWNGILQIEK